LFASVIRIQIFFTFWSTAGLYEILFCVNGTAEQGQSLGQETTVTATRFYCKKSFLKFGLIQNTLHTWC